MKTTTLLISTLFLTAWISVRADVQYWDPDADLSNNDCVTGAGLGGTGTWGAGNEWTTNECQNLGATVGWTEGNDAVFWGTAGTATLSGPQTAGNLTFKIGGYTITGSTLTLAGAGNGNVTNETGTGTIASLLAGTIGYKKYGSGTLQLNNAANTISGPLYVYAGTLRLNAYTALGANSAGQTLTLDGGTLRNDDSASGGTFLSRNVPLYIGANNGTINVNNSAAILIYSNYIYGVTTGVGTLTKSGAGEIRNYGPNGAHNTFGKLVVSAGIFCAGQSVYPGYNDTYCAIPAVTTDDAITIRSGGQLRLAGSTDVTLDVKQGITIGSGGGVIRATGGRVLTIPGSIKGGQPLTLGNGDTSTVVLSGTNALGAVTINSGVARVRNSFALADATAGTTVTNAALEVSGTISVDEPLTLYGTGISSGGALRSTANPNNWSGPITLGASGVRINGDTSTLTLSGGVAGAGDPSLTIGGAGTVVISTNALDIGAGPLTKDGTGTLTLSTSNTIGALAFNDGRINFNDNAAAGASTITVGAGADEFACTAPGIVLTNDVTLNAGANPLIHATSGNSLTVGGVFSGPGALTRDNTGSGTLTISGANTFSGGFTLKNRTVVLGHRQALGTSTLTIGPHATGATTAPQLQAAADLTGVNAITNLVIVNTNFTLGGSSSFELSGSVTLNMGPAITASGSGSKILSGVISGDPGIGLVKAGTGAGGLTLSGANTYDGGTVVSAGTLYVNNATGSGTGPGPVTVNAGATLAGTGLIAGAVTVEEGGNIAAGTSAGMLTLQNGLDLSAGGTNVWELAALKDNSDGTAGTDFDRITLTGGNLVLGGSSQLLLAFTGSASAPDVTNAFWQSNHTWTIITLGGSASNPTNSNFAQVANGTYSAGNFSTSVGGPGNVLLTFTASPAAPAPVLTTPSLSGTNLTMGWSSTAGRSYRVEYKTNLNQVGWLVLTSLTAVSSTTSIVDSTGPHPQRYYQVVLLP